MKIVFVPERQEQKGEPKIYFVFLMRERSESPSSFWNHDECLYCEKHSSAGLLYEGQIAGMDWHLQNFISRRHPGRMYARWTERVVTLLYGAAGSFKIN